MEQAIRALSLAIVLASAGWTQTRDCAALRTLTDLDLTIVTAQAIPAEERAPAHCKVTGQILPEVRFELYLPAGWNQRFLLRGNGGFAGTMDRGGAMRSMQAGFATAVTDTGHDAATEPLAAFAVNRQKLYDYAFRSLHVTTLAAKRLIQAFYGTPPRKSYYQGCSTGGRQGLILAQRFPGDFDGIIAGAPVLDFTGTMIQYAWIDKALSQAPIPLAKMKIVADAVYKECDAKDGLADGLIDDPRRCGFVPSRDLPRCQPGSDGPACLTDGQIQSLERVYSPVVVNGQTLMPGWPVSAEIAGPDGRSGWANWLLNDKGPTISVSFATSFFRFMAFEKSDPGLPLGSIDLEKDSARIDWLRPILDATQTDLGAFRERGGKLIMYYGWSDPALNPMMGLRYYESVVREMGTKTQDFFRYFTMPGVFHCGGGVGCASADFLKPLIDWVENGAAPDRILASKVVEGKTVRTRPLCPYPQEARYRGAGSIEDAASFDCAAQR